ncbi:MAG: AEC family transporter [Lachnospiraceae bacterium]|nr:AEC family transporter [Lachnospiraceae bacterium]
MENLNVAVTAVLPFLCYIGFGYMAQRFHWVDEPFMKKLNQMIFQLFFPFMMFYNIYNTDDGMQFDMKFMVIGVVSVLVLVALLMMFVPQIEKENPKRGVLVQAVYRSNFVLFAIPLTESVFGTEGVAAAASMVAVIVPLYNVLAVVILEYFRGGNVSARELIKKILKNPLIRGAIVGMLFVVFKLKLPAGIEKPVSQFAGLTTPMALFVLGSTLHFDSLKKHMKYVTGVIGVKMIFIPVIAMVVSVIFNLTEVQRFIYLTVFATPVAASSYAMAENMGGDGELAGELVVTTTAASIVTIFLWIFILKTIGLI